MKASTLDAAASSDGGGLELGGTAGAAGAGAAAGAVGGGSTADSAAGGTIASAGAADSTPRNSTGLQAGASGGGGGGASARGGGGAAPSARTDATAKRAERMFRLNLRNAEGGDPVAQLEVGKAYLDGVGCDVDVEKGRSWLQQAAQQGVNSAVSRLEALEIS